MFTLSEDLEQLRKVAAQVGARLAPGYVERDLAEKFPQEVLKLLAEANLLGLDVPEEAGGQGAGQLANGVVCEEIAAGDFSAGSLVIQSGLVPNLLHRYADPDLSAIWLPQLLAGETTAALGLSEPGVGSDLRGVQMRARLQGGDWVLRGEKSSVSLPNSKVMVVLACADDELAVFVVPTDSAGISKQPIRDVGFTSQGRAVMTFDDVRIPLNHRLGGEGAGLRQIMATLASSKVTISLCAIGTARAALAEAVDWAIQRETFAEPIARRQGVAFPLAQHAIDIDLARMLCWRALDLADKGKPWKYEAAQVKAWVPQRMVDVCRTALITIGHVGYSREHPAQARLRDVLATELAEGSENIQLILLSRELFGVTPG